MPQSRATLLVFLQLLQVATAPGPKCPSECNVKTSSRYRGVNLTDWYSAERDCRKRDGGHLVSIVSEDENCCVETIRKQLGGKKESDAWIGLNGTTDTNTLTWSNGKNVLYLNNLKTQNLPTSHECVAIEHNGNWKVYPCSSLLNYICEYPLTVTPLFPLATTSGLVTLATTTVDEQVKVSTETSYPTITTRTTSHSATAAPTTSHSATATSTTSHSATAAPTTSPSATADPTTGVLTTSMPTLSVFSRTSSAFTTIVSNDALSSATFVPVSISPLATTASYFSATLSLRSATGATFPTGGSRRTPSAVTKTLSVAMASPRTPSTADISTTPTLSVGFTSTSSDSVIGTAVGATIGVLCVVSVTTVILWLVYRHRRGKFQVSRSSYCSENYMLKELGTYETIEVDKRGHWSIASIKNGRHATAVSQVEGGDQFEQDTAVVGQELYDDATSVFPGHRDNEGKPSMPLDGGVYEVPLPDSNTISTDEKMHELGFDRLKKETFWEPATTEERLYEQIDGYKFPQISRRTIDSREYVGSGEFGTVEKATWQPFRAKESSVVVAVKTLKSETQEDRVRFLREAALLGQFHHKNIVALYGVVTAGSPLMIVLEYMENGDLKQYLLHQRSAVGSPNTSLLDHLCKVLLGMCRDIASGLEYLAGKSFVHRDLAARNILLDHKHTCKIGDFGLSRDLASETYYVTKGGKIPIRWCAPEALNFRKYSAASDVWSYGIVVYEIWSLGCRPYGVASNFEVISMTAQGYRLPPPPGCSRSLYRLMIDCWNPDNHQRPCGSDIVKRLSVADSQLLTNDKSEEEISGKLGDEPTSSANSYQDLQMTYFQKLIRKEQLNEQ